MGAGGNRSARLPREVVLLGWVSFFADVSGEMVYPLIPLFVVGVLGGSAATLGGIEGAASCVVALVTAWAGWRSDRHHRRVPFVRAGYGLPVLGKTLMAMAFAWPVLLAGRLIDRLGKGLRGSPRDALIADAAGPNIRGRAFGFHRAMDTAGAMIGVMIAAAMLWWFTGSPAGGDPSDHDAEQGWVIRMAFGVSAALGLLSLALTFFVRDVGERATGETKRLAVGRVAGLPGNYWRAVAPLLVFSFANSTDAFLLLRAKDVGLSSWAVVLAYALFNLTYAAASYPAGIISDRLGRWRVIALGWGVYAAVYAGLASTGAGAIWPLMAMYGVYMSLTDGVGKALIADHAPADARGTALGIYFLASGVITLLASTIAGLIWDRFGPSTMFWVGAVSASIAIALIPILKPRPAVGLECVKHGRKESNPQPPDP